MSQTGFQRAASRATPVTLSAIQRSLSPNEAVLEYVLDEPDSFCLHVTRDQAGLTRLPQTRDAVGKLVAAYRKEISARLYATPGAAQLYSVLLKPLPPSILKPSLIIVPDGALNLIPFDALTDTSGQYVIASHVVSYAPSGTVLCLIRQARKPNPVPLAFLGVGGVPYQAPAVNLAAAKEGPQPGAVISDPFDLNAHPLPELPSSLDEVKDAGHVFGRSSVLLLGPDATEVAFKAEPLDHFRIIHIAAHAIASARFSDRAALVLGEDSAKRETVYCKRGRFEAFI